MSDVAAHLLVVDDDERIRELLRRYLVKQGFLVSVARDGDHARRLLEGLEFDLIVMDVMMPGVDGISLTQELRKTLTSPILLLTAKGETQDRISGLEAGADDYLTKPFEPRELLLRINAILRRVPDMPASDTGPKLIKLGPLTYDAERSELQNGDDPVRLTSTEVQLMRIFTSNLGDPVTRSQLAEELGRDRGQAQERAVDVQITRLRRKLEADPKQPRYLQTVRGAGYMLVSD
ncbi:MAG: response regulator [Paracoccaceae bacterium]|jgi:two-component system phosphate regulon response regulator OmpR|nr:response regulator [Paracoccaceae bacterium]MDP7185070.1 response regulator [Paracoccaceae bacterium]